MPRPRDIDYVALRALHTKHGLFYPPDSVIFREGEVGHDFYVILEGEVEMLVQRPDGQDEVVAVLSRGDFFGEMALFRHEKRSATARARGSVSLLYFGERTATELLVNSPRFGLGIIRALCDRVGAADHEIVLLRHALDAHRAFETDQGLSFTPPSHPSVQPAPAAHRDSAKRRPEVVTERDIDQLWAELAQRTSGSDTQAASDAAAAALPELPVDAPETGR